MSRVLVTGASGFLGAGLLPFLAERGFSLSGVARHSPPRELASLADWHSIDLGADPSLPASAWRGVEAVVHLAAIAHTDLPDNDDSRQRLARLNVEAPLALAARASAEGVSRFVFVSSATVHGIASRGAPFSEESPIAPRTLYGQSKAIAEARLREATAQSGLPLTIVRPPLVYGPGAKGNLERLLRWAEAGRPLPSAVQHNRRSLIGLENLCRYLMAALRHPEAAGETFLLSDTEAISTGTLYRDICSALGRDARLLPLPPGALAMLLGVTGRAGLLERLCGDFRLDTRKAVALLGQQATTARAEEIGRMVARWRAAPP